MASTIFVTSAFTILSSWRALTSKELWLCEHREWKSSYGGPAKSGINLFSWTSRWFGFFYTKFVTVSVSKNEWTHKAKVSLKAGMVVTDLDFVAAFRFRSARSGPKMYTSTNGRNTPVVMVQFKSEAVWTLLGVSAREGERGRRIKPSETEGLRQNIYGLKIDYPTRISQVFSSRIAIETD